MADGNTLLTQMMAKIVGNITLGMDPKFHACIESLLQAKCDPNQPSADEGQSEPLALCCHGGSNWFEQQL